MPRTSRKGAKSLSFLKTILCGLVCPLCRDAKSCVSLGSSRRETLLPCVARRKILRLYIYIELTLMIASLLRAIKMTLRLRGFAWGPMRWTDTEEETFVKLFWNLFCFSLLLRKLVLPLCRRNLCICQLTVMTYQDEEVQFFRNSMKNHNRFYHNRLEYFCFYSLNSFIN